MLSKSLSLSSLSPEWRQVWLHCGVGGLSSSGGRVLGLPPLLLQGELEPLGLWAGLAGCGCHQTPVSQGESRPALLGVWSVLKGITDQGFGEDEKVGIVVSVCCRHPGILSIVKWQGLCTVNCSCIQYNVHLPNYTTCVYSSSCACMCIGIPHSCSSHTTYCHSHTVCSIQLFFFIMGYNTVKSDKCKSRDCACQCFWCIYITESLCFPFHYTETPEHCRTWSEVAQTDGWCCCKTWPHHPVSHQLHTEAVFPLIIVSPTSDTVFLYRINCSKINMWPVNFKF